MRKRFKLALSVTALCLLSFLFFKNGYMQTKHKHIPSVTYTFSNGRFGDNLFSYLRAKWISHIYHYPIAYKPFAFSDQLLLDDLETNLFKKDKQNKEVLYTNSLTFKQSRTKPTTYVIPYFPEVTYEINTDQDWQYFQVDWKDPTFRKEIQKCLTPKIPIEPIQFPLDTETVAVHIRTGIGYDTDHTRKSCPLKFPPMQYFTSQISQLCRLLDPQKKIYLRIFTDDPNPERLVNKLEEELQNPNIEYAYKKPQNTSPLQDFFHMMQFDYLIRSDSNLSILASLLRDYRIAIYPAHFHRQNDLVTIDQAKWVFNSPSL